MCDHRMAGGGGSGRSDTVRLSGALFQPRSSFCRARPRAKAGGLQTLRSALLADDQAPADGRAGSTSATTSIRGADMSKDLNEAKGRIRQRIAEEMQKHHSALIGITDPKLATIATYQEFGWVQRVTKQRLARSCGMGQGSAGPGRPRASSQGLPQHRDGEAQKVVPDCPPRSARDGHS